MFLGFVPGKLKAARKHVDEINYRSTRGTSVPMSQQFLADKTRNIPAFIHLIPFGNVMRIFGTILLINGLDQRCPTLSPIATCGDKHFKCGDRPNSWILVSSSIFIFLKSFCIF
jgi:hypothetical protein